MVLKFWLIFLSFCNAQRQKESSHYLRYHIQILVNEQTWTRGIALILKKLKTLKNFTKNIKALSEMMFYESISMEGIIIERQLSRQNSRGTKNK